MVENADAGPVAEASACDVSKTESEIEKHDATAQADVSMNNDEADVKGKEAEQNASVAEAEGGPTAVTREVTMAEEGMVAKPVEALPALEGTTGVQEGSAGNEGAAVAADEQGPPADLNDSSPTPATQDELLTESQEESLVPDDQPDVSDPALTTENSSSSKMVASPSAEAILAVQKPTSEGLSNKRNTQNSSTGTPQGSSSFGFFNRLPAFRSTSGFAGSGGVGEKQQSQVFTGAAVSSNAREVLKGAEKLQESAKTAISSFLSNSNFSKGLLDSHYDKVPLVDTPSDSKPVLASGQFGSMWKQLASLPLTGVGATVSSGTAGNPNIRHQVPSTVTKKPVTIASKVEPVSVQNGAAADGAESSLVKSDAAAANEVEMAPSAQEIENVSSGAKTSEGIDSKIEVKAETSADTPSNMTLPVKGSVAGKGTATGTGTIGLLTKNILDGSKTSLKVIQTKARHMVSQNKRRYQEDGFDLDMAYVTENIIAMGFPGGDISSGIIGYVEGFYRNHMEDVIRFLETRHKEKYKVYNLCSERLYDAALFEGKVATFPFEDHNCPPLSLLMAFCESAYDWLKGGLDRVCVVHCRAGMARTGLMVCCLLLYSKVFTSVEEAVVYYNNKRTTDGKALVLPSQVRYVHYFNRILTDFDSITPSPRKCILRGIRLHKCPYWIRPGITVSNHSGVLFSSRRHPQTRDLLPDDIWHNAPRKGVVVFALPGERCVAEVAGDFKISFQDRHGDFYCWLNTSMMQTRQILNTGDLDGFDKRRLGSPGFQVEVVVLDHDSPLPSKPKPLPPPATDSSKVPPKASAPQGPSALSAAATAAASATVNAFQAFVGGGAPAGEKGERKGGVAADSASRGRVSPGQKVREAEAGPAVASSPSLHKVEEDVGVLGNDDIFSDSDSEEEESKAMEDQGKRQKGAAEQPVSGSGQGEAGNPAPGTAAAALNLFTSALTSSVKDLGDGFNAMGGVSLRNAMDSFRMGNPAAQKEAFSSSGSIRAAAAEDKSSGGERRQAPILRGGSGANVASLDVPAVPHADPGKELSREGSSLSIPSMKAESSTRDSGEREGATSLLGKAESVYLSDGAAGNEGPISSHSSDFKALAAASSADMSVFTFGDDEDFDDEQ